MDKKKEEALFSLLLHRLQAAFKEEVAYLTSQKADLLFEHQGQRYAVELKVAKEARRSELEGKLALAILQAIAVAKQEQALPVAIVGAPRLSLPLIESLRAFVDEYIPGMIWGAVDEDGFVGLFGLSLQIPSLHKRKPRALKIPQTSLNHFTDLGQWMLKMLLNHRLPTLWQIYPSSQDLIPNASHLAEQAGVSVAQTFRFINHLRQEHYLEDDNPLNLVRIEDLLQRWQSIYQIKQPPEIGMRLLLPRRDPLHHLEDTVRKLWSEKHRISFGLFVACDYWDFSFVHGVAPHIYVDTLSSELFKAMKLTIANPGEAVDVFVRKPLYPETVFRGVQLRDGLPVTDLLQCWLDVVAHPARGQEMGQVLYQKVLQPYLIGAY